MAMVRIISEDAIDKHLSLRDCIDAVERLHESFASGQATSGLMESKVGSVPNPPREEQESPLLYELRTMDGLIEPLGVASVRINSDIVQWPPNDGRAVRNKLPLTVGEYYNGLVILLSMDTGEPLAIFPDAIIQHFRVASSSVLGAKYLANENPSVLGMFGTGWQARSHLPAYDILFDLEEINVYSPTTEHREMFASEMNDEVDPEVNAVDAPEHVFTNADIVQCVTNAIDGGVFDTDWIHPGTHIGLIRSDEAPEDFYSTSTIDTLGTNFPPIIQHELHGFRYSRHEKRMNTWNNYVTDKGESVPRLKGEKSEGPSISWEGDVISLSALVEDTSHGRSTSEEVSGYLTAGLGADFAALGDLLYKLAETKDLGDQLPLEVLSQKHHP